MSWLEDLETAVAAESAVYLATRGFVERGRAEGPGMGACIEYVSPQLELTFINDRGVFSVEVSSATASRRCDIPRLMALINVGPISQGSKDALLAILTRPHTLNEEVAFLNEHHDTLVRMFAAQHIETTLRHIDELGKLRAEALFGPF